MNFPFIIPIFGQELKMQEKTDFTQIREKIIAGTKLAFLRMVEKAIANDDYLVFSENGKVVKIRARDYNLEELKKSL